MKSLDSAKETLSYYFQTVWEQAGLNGSTDNQSEIEGMVDDMCDAIKRDLAEKENHHEKNNG